MFSKLGLFLGFVNTACGPGNSRCLSRPALLWGGDDANAGRRRRRIRPGQRRRTRPRPPPPPSARRSADSAPAESGGRSAGRGRGAARILRRRPSSRPVGWAPAGRLLLGYGPGLPARDVASRRWAESRYGTRGATNIIAGPGRHLGRAWLGPVGARRGGSESRGDALIPPGGWARAARLADGRAALCWYAPARGGFGAGLVRVQRTRGGSCIRGRAAGLCFRSS